jgi:hypothetical protein
MRATGVIGSGLGLLLLGIAAGAGPARAEPAAPPVSARAQVDEVSAQARRRPPRVRIYRSGSYPGPNSKRECVARYEQEVRVSGTYVVPRMRCWWTPG